MSILYLHYDKFYILCFVLTLYGLTEHIINEWMNESEPLLYRHDTSVIITNRNFKDFSSVSNLVLSHMIEWFEVNKLVLNLKNQI